MSLINCPECESQISNWAAACPKCDEKIVGKCPECDAVRSGNSSKCAQCGYPFGPTSPALKATPSSKIRYIQPEKSKVKAPPTETFLAAFIGPKKTAYYLRAFTRFRVLEDFASWSWPAFFMTTPWLLYRKMWLYAIACFLGSVFLSEFIQVIMKVLGLIPNLVDVYGITIDLYDITFVLIVFLVPPVIANRLYYHHARKKMESVMRSFDNKEEQIEELTRIGGVASDKVLVAIGVIAVAHVSFWLSTLFT